MPAWNDYQEYVATFLRAQPGVTAEMNVPVTGSHGTNDIDVVAKFWTLGQEVTLLIECKKWKTAVTQEKPQAFCRVVETMGADRGLLVAENGFQSGCYDIVKNTNVHLATLKELKASVKAALDIVPITDLRSGLRWLTTGITSTVRARVSSTIFDPASGRAQKTTIQLRLFCKRQKGFSKVRRSDSTQRPSSMLGSAVSSRTPKDF
jgi:hypothetical protein